MNTKMIRSTTLALVAALSLTAVALPGTALAAKSAKVKVTLKSNGGDFSGRVKSKSADCIAERQVVVYEQAGSKPKPATDEIYSSDTSEQDGSWSLGNNRASGATFYAYVAKIQGCKAATSKSVTEPEDPFADEDL